MNIFRNVDGKLYIADAATSSADSMLPICTKELMDILTIAKKPLSEAEIEFCKVAIATAVPEPGEQLA